MSFHGAVKSMEQTKLDSQQYVATITHYLSEENSKARKQNIEPFAQWLTDKRNVFHNDNDWNEFCKNNHTLLKFTIGALPMFKFPETLNLTPGKMIDVIMDRAYKLQPESSSQELTDTIDQDLITLYHACFKDSK